MAIPFECTWNEWIPSSGFEERLLEKKVFFFRHTVLVGGGTLKRHDPLNVYIWTFRSIRPEIFGFFCGCFPHLGERALQS